MRQISNLKLLALPLAASAIAVQASAAERPNILVIMADDLLTAELGCYGGVNIATPNIDQLAKEGVRFTNNYASTAMSVPIRASLYTGLFPAHHGSYQNHKNTFMGTKTVNDYMPSEGYRVARAGKNHPAPQALYAFRELPGFPQNCVADAAAYNTDGVKKFINESDDPFLLYVCSINPHAPWTLGDPSEFDPSEFTMPPFMVDNAEVREIFTHYLAEIRVLDNEVGAVMKVLRESGKLDNTIVMFLGEQGPQFPGGKWTSWHAGVNSAMIARYPERIKAGRVCEALVQYEDILPTFIDIAGGDEVAAIDGSSFKSALFGESSKHRDWVYGIHNNYPEGTPYPIRSIRDERYKLILNLRWEDNYFEKHVMNPNGSPTGIWEAMNLSKGESWADYIMNRYVTRPAVEFYDMKNDPYEFNNLAGEPKYKERIARMSRELDYWMQQQGDVGAGMDVEFKNYKFDKKMHNKLKSNK